MSGVTVRELSPARESAWQEYVMGHPQGTLFHDLAWRDMLRKTFRHRCCYLFAERDGKLCGVLPLVIIRSVFFGTSAVSVPFGVYGGVIADDAASTEGLCDAATEAAADAGAAYVELRHLHLPPACDLPESGLHCTFIKALPARVEDVLPGIPRKARAEVRKARAAGTLRVNTKPVPIPVFHALFAENKRKLGSPIFPQSMFWNLLEVLPGRVHTMAVEQDGRAIAVLMSFLWRGQFMAYYSGASESANANSANNLMYAAAMEEAVRLGATHFDFGRSRRDTGPYAFKVNQGFEPTPVHYQFVTKRGATLPSINASNPRYDFAKRLFRALPRVAAEKLGSFVAKRMPV
ncbi:MAG: FemAB family PEP-CTERM system-associated protein [Planctomycetes bacterium]|nr:FemAB family PEP-CTERM system-associated protein [Planctomycetota bacterium]